MDVAGDAESAARIAKRLASQGNGRTLLAAKLICKRTNQDSAHEGLGTVTNSQMETLGIMADLPTSHWDSLPAEILRPVLSSIGPEHSASARQVCRWWRSNHDASLTRLVPPRLCLGPVMELFPNLQTLDTCNAAGRVWPPLHSHDALVGVRETLTQLTRLTGLTDLSLGGAGSVTYNGSSMGTDCAVLSALAASLPGLKRLSLAMCLLVRPAFLNVLAPLVNLRELDMEGCDQLRDSGLISISKVLFSLEWLHVGGCTMITDVGIRALADLPNLKTLNTPGCILLRGASHSILKSLTSIDMSRVEAFPSLSALVPIAPQLKRLEIAGCRLVADNSLPLALPALTNLTVLNLEGCTSLTVVGLPVPGSLRSLTDLNISDCRRLSPGTLELVAKSMIRLRRLAARNCLWISDEVLAKLSDLPLEHLDLRGCTSITDAGIERILHGKVAATLKNLHLEVPGMSDVSARMLAGTLRRLQALSLEGASALTRDGLWQMMAMMNANIQHLVLGPCRQLDDNGLKALVQTLPNLQSLCLNGCPDLRDVTPLSQLSQLTSLTVKKLWSVRELGWAELGPLPCLRNFHAEDCQRISVDSMIGVAERLPRLKSLELRDCRAVGDPLLEHVKHCKSLSSIDLSGTPVTDTGLKVLATMMLQHIKLEDCMYVSPHFTPFVPHGSVGLSQVLHWMVRGR